MIQINEILNSDCFDIFPQIDDNMIDLVLVDLPFGCTSNEWDVKIDLKNMWTQLKRICKPQTTYIFYCSTKYGNDLINSNPGWFRYDLVSVTVLAPARHSTRSASAKAWAVLSIKGVKLASTPAAV